MVNKKNLVSALSILSVLAMTGGATFATFSSNATSSANVFSTGTLNLALCDVNEPCPTGANATQSVTASFGLTNMKPGDCTGVQNLTLSNTGTINAGSVDITASNSDATLASWLRINSLTYDGVAKSVGPNSNATAFLDLGDFQTNPLTGLPGINAGATKVLAMDVCLDQSATTAVQGLTDTLTLSVNLKQ